jgi:hypothetical protein
VRRQLADEELFELENLVGDFEELRASMAVRPSFCTAVVRGSFQSRGCSCQKKLFLRIIATDENTLKRFCHVQGQVLTEQMIHGASPGGPTFAAASKLHKLLILSTTMTSDAAFCRQARRKYL